MAFVKQKSEEKFENTPFPFGDETYGEVKISEGV
jgi:hypothetical protein